MRSFLMKMSWFLRGALEVPSMSVPARMMVSASWAWAAGCEIAMSGAAQRNIAANFRVGMEVSEEAGVACSRKGGICKVGEFRFGNLRSSGSTPWVVLGKSVNVKQLREILGNGEPIHSGAYHMLTGLSI